MLARLEMRVFALGNCLILLPGSNLDLECIKINTQMIVDVVNQMAQYYHHMHTQSQRTYVCLPFCPMSASLDHSWHRGSRLQR